jgi:hypothetical protein
VFATFTNALSTAGQVGLNGSAGQGQARYNNNMSCVHEYVVTGRKGKTKNDTPSAVVGSFHQLPEELTDKLIVTGQMQSNATCKDFDKLLFRQEEKTEE